MKHKINKGSVPTLTCKLEAGESITAQTAYVSDCTPGIQSASTGGFGKIFKRALAGENVTQTVYKAKSAGSITFTMPKAGSIMAYDLTGNLPILVQKPCIIAYEKAIDSLTALRRQLIGPDSKPCDFIMEQLGGKGYAFIKVEGDLAECVLKEREYIVVPTFSVVGCKGKATLEIGRTNLATSDESAYQTTINGPGIVWLQNGTEYEIMQNNSDSLRKSRKKK